jgi:probable rRNA maturation factor
MVESSTPNIEPPETMSIEIEVSDTQAHMKVDRADVMRIVRHVLLAENRVDASISIALVDNDTIHRLNMKHLGHDWPTDVITFPLSGDFDPVLAGELVVSAEMAVSTAREMGSGPRHEVGLYLVHGLLHLCGYDDSNEAAASAMHRRQSELLDAAAGLRTD